MKGDWIAQWVPGADRWTVYRTEIRYDSLGWEQSRRRTDLGGLYDRAKAELLARSLNQGGEQETMESDKPRRQAHEQTHEQAHGQTHGQTGICRQCRINEIEVRAARLCRPCYNRMRRMGLTTKLGWCDCGHPAKVEMTATTSQGEEAYVLCAACAAEELRTRAILAGAGLGPATLSAGAAHWA